MTLTDQARPAGHPEVLGPEPRLGPGGRAGPRPGPREERLNRLMGRWWRQERPGWTELSWWDASLHEPVRNLLWLHPGPALVSALDDLGAMATCPMDHTEDRILGTWPIPGTRPGWPCACQVIAAAAWEACASWVAVGATAALVRAAGPEPVRFTIAGGRQQVLDPAREELAHALRTSIPAMGNRIGAARAVASHPTLVAHVCGGTMSSWTARLVTEHLRDLEPDQARRVIDEVCGRITQRLASGRRPYHSAEVNRLARAARLRLCPETEREARVRALVTRRVTLQPGPDGMATLVAELADVDAHRIHRRLTSIAAGLRSCGPADGRADRRTRDQLRADVLVDLLLARPTPHPTSIAGPDAPDAIPAPGSEIQVEVVVRLETLLGLADDPAEVPGVGPLPAELARALAADGRWRAWIADATGTITATGTRAYTPSASVARLVRARESRCRFPGCHQPARRCDLDHTTPWPHGGTTPENLGPLCRHHHILKTHAPWLLTGAGAGWRWRTPAGFEVHDGPEPPLGPPSRDTPSEGAPSRSPVPRGVRVTSPPRRC